MDELPTAQLSPATLAGVVVGEERRRRPAGLRVERLADAQVERVLGRLAAVALVAGPAEVARPATPSGRGSGRSPPRPGSPRRRSRPRSSPAGARCGTGCAGRRPTMRRALASVLDAIGLSGRPAPVAGSTRMTVPPRHARTPGGAPRALAAQRPALGGRWRERRPDAARRIAAGVLRDGAARGAAAVAVVRAVGVRRLAPRWRTARRRRRTRGRRPSARGYCWHQSWTRTSSAPVMTLPLARRRDRRPLAGHPSVIGPGGEGQASFQRPAAPPIGPS